jgi:hypothetical protein
MRDKEKKQDSSAQANALKGALADVVAGRKEPASVPPVSAQKPERKAPQRPPARSADQPRADAGGKTPFEVPENTLRSLFKDE